MKNMDDENYRDDYPKWDLLQEDPAQCPICEKVLLGGNEVEGWYCPDILICRFAISYKRYLEILEVARMDEGDWSDQW